MNNVESPKAREDGLVVQKMPDELLVYDRETNKAHCLNDTVARVWNACDGKHSVAEIAEAFEGVSDNKTRNDIVRLAIDQLHEFNLLEGENSISLSGRSRRELIKRIGFASVVAIPVIASLAAPKSALAAASCICVAPGDCATQTGCPSLINCAPTGICSP